jgi:hypothetical protein
MKGAALVLALLAACAAGFVIGWSLHRPAHQHTAKAGPSRQYVHGRQVRMYRLASAWADAATADSTKLGMDISYTPKRVYFGYTRGRDLVKYDILSVSKGGTILMDGPTCVLISDAASRFVAGARDVGQESPHSEEVPCP